MSTTGTTALRHAGDLLWQVMSEATITMDGREFADPETEADALRVIGAALHLAPALVHRRNKKWWVDIHTGEPIKRNVGELLMLCVSELAEAMEGHRKHLPDDHLPHRDMFDVEIADAFIRLFDLAGGLNVDLSGAFLDKMEYNRTREDHTLAARRGTHGKKY